MRITGSYGEWKKNYNLIFYLYNILVVLLKRTYFAGQAGLGRAGPIRTERHYAAAHKVELLGHDPSMLIASGLFFQVRGVLTSSQLPK